jgi:hypothetical protein
VKSYKPVQAWTSAFYAIEATGSLVRELLLSGAIRYAALWAANNHDRSPPFGHSNHPDGALICGTCTTVSSSRWLLKISPQGHRIKELGFCDGILSPASHIAYQLLSEAQFEAVSEHLRPYLAQVVLYQKN